MRRTFAGPQSSRDNNNYRVNAVQNKPIQQNAITFEGIISEYSFNIKKENDLLFNTYLSCAVSKNIETGNQEHYIVLQMVSKLDGEGLAAHGGRPPMNFAFALDVSGSMTLEFVGDVKSKLDVAKECLINLLSRLLPDDKFGLILFDEGARTLIELTSIKLLDLSDVKQRILGVEAGGGTSILAGLQAAEQMLSTATNDPEVRRNINNVNRVLFLTDLNPSGSEQQELLDFAHATAKKRIFMTLIGIGFDFNSDLNYKLAKVKGNNSYGVISANQFRKQMISEFNHNSIMIVYDVSLKMTSSNFEVVAIYGSPATPDKAAGEVLKIESVSPSAGGDEGIKGGIVVLKLKKKDAQIKAGETLSFKLSYKDWNDETFEKEMEFTFPDDPEKEMYEDNSIRKAIALIRYVELVKRVLGSPGSPGNREILEKCKKYIGSEILVLNDTSMDKELLLLDTHITNNR